MYIENIKTSIIVQDIHVINPISASLLQGKLMCIGRSYSEKTKPNQIEPWNQIINMQYKGKIGKYFDI